MHRKSRTTLRCLAAMFLPTAYGGQVCPLIDTLPPTHWGTLVAIVFIPMALARTWLPPRLPDGDTGACEKAAACAEEMPDRLDRLNQSPDTPLSVGVGIHKGEVPAGIVGSPERLEFTAAGDAVNTAARIEKLTRRLKADILVSEAVRGGLSGRRAWKGFGGQSFEGKSEKLRLCGL